MEKNVDVGLPSAVLSENKIVLKWYTNAPLEENCIIKAGRHDVREETSGQGRQLTSLDSV